jgi:HD-like signal output (HDOD) protein
MTGPFAVIFGGLFAGATPVKNPLETFFYSGDNDRRSHVLKNLQMTKLLDSKDLKQVLASAQLPALPSSAIRLLELAQDPSNGPAEFAKPIEADAGLLGQVLKFVNSAYFGFSREIGSVQQAISLVGVRTVKNFVLWSAVFSLIPNPKFGPFDLRSLWQDSLRRAVFARAFARRLKLSNAEDLFAAALLQDMAIPLLLKSLPDEYEKLIERRVTERMRLSTLEREVFGWDHAEAAAALCRNWGLPEEFAILIERHPNLDELLNGDKAQRDAGCVAVAALLPACKDEEWSERDQFFSSLERVAAGTKYDVAEISQYVDECFEEFAPVLNLPVPDVSLTDWFTGEPAKA